MLIRQSCICIVRHHRAQSVPLHLFACASIASAAHRLAWLHWWLVLSRCRAGTRADAVTSLERCPNPQMGPSCHPDIEAFITSMCTQVCPRLTLSESPGISEGIIILCDFQVMHGLVFAILRATWYLLYFPESMCPTSRLRLAGTEWKPGGSLQRHALALGERCGACRTGPRGR